jgi:hypothetical protein
VDRHLLLNMEPSGVPRFRFPAARRIDAALVNREEGEVRPFEPEFTQLLGDGQRTPIVSDRYRRALLPLVPLLGTRGFMIISEGGDKVAMANVSGDAVTRQ